MSQPQLNKLKIANPPLEDEVRAYLTSDVNSAGTTIAVTSTTGFAISGTTDYFIIICDYGSEKTEITKVDVSDGGTNVNGFKVASLSFSHEASDPVTFMRYNKIKVYGSASSGGLKTPIDTIDIDPTQQFTEYTYEGNDYSFFYVTYLDDENTKESAFSEEIETTSFGRTSVKKIIKSALGKAMTKIDESHNSLLNWDSAIEVVNDGLDEILLRKRNWSFLHVRNQGTNTTAGSPIIAKPTNLSLLQFLVVDNRRLEWISQYKYNSYTEAGIVSTTGNPTHYTEKGNTYYTYPTPNGSYEVYREYYKVPDMVTSLSSPVDREFVSLLIYYCAAQFSFIRGNDKRGDKMYGMFEKNLEQQAIEFSGPFQIGDAEAIESTNINYLEE